MTVLKDELIMNKKQKTCLGFWNANANFYSIGDEFIEIKLLAIDTFSAVPKEEHNIMKQHLRTYTFKAERYEKLYREKIKDYDKLKEIKQEDYNHFTEKINEMRKEIDKLKEENKYWKRQYDICNLTSANIPKEKVRNCSNNVISLFKQFKTNNGRLADLDWVIEELDKYQKQLLGEK